MIAGAVLAGGASKRFGRNKALEVFQGKRLVDRSLESVAGLCDPVFLVANDLGPYLDVTATLVQDVVLHQGPLGGLYTALLFSPRDWLLVKATDMPFFVPELIRWMQGLTEDAEAVVPESRGWYEPLMALYHRRCLPFMADALENKRKQIISFYSEIKLKTVPEEQWRAIDPDGRAFMNINRPEDWERLTWS